MYFGIIGALQAEVDLIKGKMAVDREEEMLGTCFYHGHIGRHEAVIVKCGVGKINAAACAMVLLREFGADFIINAGIAGAMADGLRTMDVVISSRAALHDQDPIMLGYYPGKQFFEAEPSLIQLCEDACSCLDLEGKYIVGTVASGDIFVSDNQTKRRIKEAFDPACVEMEGGAVAHVSYMNGKPFLIIRTMSDCADEDASQTYDDLFERAAHQSAQIVLKMLEIAK